MVWVTSGKWVATIHRPASSTPMPAMNRRAPGPAGRREAAMPTSEHSTMMTAGTMLSTNSAVSLVLMAGPLNWGSAAQRATGSPTRGSRRGRSGPAAGGAVSAAGSAFLGTSSSAAGGWTPARRGP